MPQKKPKHPLDCFAPVDSSSIAGAHHLTISSSKQWKLEIPFQELCRIRIFRGGPRCKFFGGLKDKILRLCNKVCMVVSWDSSRYFVRWIFSTRLEALLACFENMNFVKRRMKPCLFFMSCCGKPATTSSPNFFRILIAFHHLYSNCWTWSRHQNDRSHVPLTLCLGSVQPSRYISTPHLRTKPFQHYFMVPKAGHDILAL